MGGRAHRGCGRDWKQRLVSISGSVEEDLLLRIESLVAEHRIVRDQIKRRVQLSDTERRTLAEMGKKLSTQALEEGATIVKSETILAWHRTLVTQKCEGSQHRKSPGRPRVDPVLEDQGKGNVLPFPASPPANDREAPIACHERLGGRRKYDERQAA